MEEPLEALMLALLLLAAVLVSSVIDQLVPKISSPLIQILLGLGIALLASSQIKIELDDKLFLVLFIAPLLYDEAKNIDKASLWRNRKPVLSLAIGLVVVTALIIGFAVEWLEPSIGLFAAFALGAALGTTARFREVVQQQMLEGRVGQHDAEFGEGVGQAGSKNSIGALAQQHDGALRGREDALLRLRPLRNRHARLPYRPS